MSTHRPAKDLAKQVIETLKELKARRDLSSPDFDAVMEYLYQPDPRLKDKIALMRDYLVKPDPSKAERRAAGLLMEEIAYVAFLGLGFGFKMEIQSFQSASGPAFDLLVTGDAAEWPFLCDFLGMSTQQTILVECKATEATVNDAQFIRMCGLLEMNLRGNGGLGVFFSANGASGFPKKGERRRRCMSDCLLRQLLFHVRTGRAIVVIDKDDLEELAQGENLAILIRRKVREIQQNPGLHTAPLTTNPTFCSLPAHLSQLAKTSPI